MSVIAGPPPPRPSEVRWFGKNPLKELRGTPYLTAGYARSHDLQAVVFKID